MSQHPAASWTLSKKMDSTRMVLNAEGYSVAQVICLDEQGEKNARLICAAPALRSTLKSIMDGGIADPAEVAKAMDLLSQLEA